MSKYNYQLNSLFSNNTYDELLEIYNEFNLESLITESIKTMPVNKLKEIAKKMSSIKDEKQMKDFVTKNKRLVKPQKELKQNVYKIGRQLGFEQREIKDAEYSLVKGIAAGVSSILLSPIALPLLLIAMVNAKVKKVDLNVMIKQVLADLDKSIQQKKKGPYTSALNITINGIIFFIVANVIAFLGSMATGVFATGVAAGLVGGAGLLAIVLIVLGTIGFMWTFLGTSGRIQRGE